MTAQWGSCSLSSVSSMSEDDGHESGCDTVEGSPTSDTSTSPRGNSPYRYLDNSNHNNRPPLAAMVAPLPSPAVQGRSPRGVRTMVVPPMRVQNNNNHGTNERFHRTGQCCCLLLRQEANISVWAWVYWMTSSDYTQDGFHRRALVYLVQPTNILKRDVVVAFFGLNHNKLREFGAFMKMFLY